MYKILLTVLIRLLTNKAHAIECILSTFWTSFSPNQTCAGDYCFYYVGGIEPEQGCVTGLRLDSGCFTNANAYNATFCICSEDYCNENTESIRGQPIGEAECRYYTDTRGSIAEYTSDDAHVCVSDGKFYVNEDGQEEFYFNNRPHYSDVVPNNLYEFRVNIHGLSSCNYCFDFYYFGETYAFEYYNGTLDYFQVCNKNNCNNLKKGDVVIKEENSVTCVLHYVWADFDTTCMGHFCVISIKPEIIDYGTGETKNVTFQYCMSTSTREAEDVIGVGMYQLWATHYVCNTPLCNSNVTTAEEAIEEYKAMVLADPELAHRPSSPLQYSLTIIIGCLFLLINF